MPTTNSHKNKPGVANFEAGVENAADETIGTSTGEHTGGVASEAMRRARDAASFVGDKAEAATEALGHGMESLGGAVRGESSQGMFGGARKTIADTLEGTGKYLEGEGLKGLAQDVTNVIRHNPIPALLFGVGIGFLMARLLARR